jgi:hypothetical protein
MSPVPARPASADLQACQPESPVETDKMEYGYGDVEPENKISVRSPTRVMEMPPVTPQKAQRRGSAFARLQILIDVDITELDTSDSIYEDNDEDEDIRFTNKITRPPPSDPRRAKVRRRGSALGRLQDDSTLSPSGRPGTGYGYHGAGAGIQESDKSVYGYEDADTNRKMVFTQRPKEAKSRRRGSALGRLQEDSKLTSSSRGESHESDKSVYGYEDADAGIQELRKSAYGYRDADAGAQELDESDCGYEDVDAGIQDLKKSDYGYEDADAGIQELDKSDYGYEDADAGINQHTATSDYGYEDADGSRKMTSAHSPKEAKSRRRGSALGRLQEDSTSSSRAGIQESDKSVYGYEDADANSKMTSTHSPKETKARRRGSALGRLQEDSTLDSSSKAGIQDLDQLLYGYEDADAGIIQNRKMTPFQDDSKGRSTSRSARLDIPDAAPPRQLSRRRMSVGEVNAKWTSPTNLVIPDAAPPKKPIRRRMSVSSTTESSSAPAPPQKGSHRRMSVGATIAPPKPNVVQPSVSASSRQNESKERDLVQPNVSARIRQNESKERDLVQPNVSAKSRQDASKERDSRPTRRVVNRRGSACGRLQSGWDGAAPCSTTLDRIQLAQGKMGVGASNMPRLAYKTSRSVNVFSIPW